MAISGTSTELNKYKLVKWFFFSIVAILVFIFFAYYANQFSDTSLTMDLSNKTIKINTTNLLTSDTEVNEFNPNDYFIDSNGNFLFEKPDSDWNGPQFISGADEYLKIKSVVFNAAMKETYDQLLSANPYGDMIKNLEGVRFTFGQSLKLEITDSSSNDLIESMISGLVDSYQGDISEQDLIYLRRQLIGFEELSFENEFIALKYDKDFLRGKPVKQSLSNFAINFISSAGLGIDNLVANNSSILTGISTNINNIRIDGKIGNVMFDRLFFITESEDNYYLVEIGYSPETESSVKLWGQLESMLNSFTVIN